MIGSSFFSRIITIAGAICVMIMMTTTMPNRNFAAAAADANIDAVDENELIETGSGSNIHKIDIERKNRQLDSSFQRTQPPTPLPTPVPTSRPSPRPTPAPITRAPIPPTRPPTPRPTRPPTPTRAPVPPTLRPTRAPVAPTKEPTSRPTNKGAAACGSFLTVGANLTLGPYEYSSERSCNQGGTGSWYSKSYYSPSFMYSFRLTQQCQYTFRDPTDPTSNGEYVEVRDVNSWFEAAAKKFQRPGNSAYRVSNANIGFTGFVVPDLRHPVLYKTETAGSDSWCPEDYCVKVYGPSIGIVKNNYDAVEGITIQEDEPAFTPPIVGNRRGGILLEPPRGEDRRNLNDNDIVWSIGEEGEYHWVKGTNALREIRSDETSAGFKELFKTHDALKVTTLNNGWADDFFLPPPDEVPVGTKILFDCQSNWGFDVYYNGDMHQRVGPSCENVRRCKAKWTTYYPREFLLVALDDTFNIGHKRWFIADDYVSNEEKYYVSNEEKYELNEIEDAYGHHSNLYNSDYVQYGCTDFISYKNRYAVRKGFTQYHSPTFSPDYCNELCSNSGYDFFGFECPLSTQVYCQCYHRDGRAIGSRTGFPIEVADCKARVKDDPYERGDGNCIGPATIDGISLGGANIGSIYRVNHPDDEGPITSYSDTASSTHELIYAFSHKDAAQDFYKMVYDTMKSKNRKNIFLTNHFLKCGCESFCLEDAPDPWRDYQPQATCYVEEVCGERVFKISYTQDYPEDQKPPWVDTGTTDVMDWFTACAHGQYKCVVHPKFAQFGLFKGIDPLHSSKTFPKEFRFKQYGGFREVYGLGGLEEDGFPSSTSSQQPIIAWVCNNRDRRHELDSFGSIIAQTGFMRGDYEKPMKNEVPTKPCAPEIINPPDEPDISPPVGPDCEDVDSAGYCMQLPEGTCFIREAIYSCTELEFVVLTSSGEKVYTDVQKWLVECIETTTDCTHWTSSNGEGQLTYKGGPKADPSMSSNSEWMFTLSNRVVNGEDTMIDGSIYFYCLTWEGAYQAKNFTYGGADRYKIFGNTFGDVFTVEDTSDDCTHEPTNEPSPYPTITAQPTDIPSQAPTVCSESYLNNDNLNIALVIDLSFSTYEKTFSSEVDIGDVNGDGKGNTILDAQVVAIQDLLMSIADSPTLDNTNTEIGVISFETDATSHGVWQPLQGDSFNRELMEYIKKELRAPIRNGTIDEVYGLNNGYTNFDAALDRAVEYFENEATPDRLNLMVFLSDGEPNVRGDGDAEMYCADSTTFWNDNNPGTLYHCSDLNLRPGQPHTFCRGNDKNCVEGEPYQDCVRGPNKCFFSDAVQQYDSELTALDSMKVARLAIGVGDESNVTEGSALWMIDDNPGKQNGILPERVLSLEELSMALKSLCILNTDPPTDSPSARPSLHPTKSPAPSDRPSDLESSEPSDSPSVHPTTSEPTDNAPSSSPTGKPSDEPSTSAPSKSPTKVPTGEPSGSPTIAPSTTSSTSPSGSFFPSIAPSKTPTKSPAPSGLPTSAPTTSNPSILPWNHPTSRPSSYSSTASPSFPPSRSSTSSPTVSSQPTFALPDCYNGRKPMLIEKDSSSDATQMCYYDADMVQINDMKKTNVTISINNVWTASVLPQELQVFINTRGIDSVRSPGNSGDDDDGFQCLDDDGTDIDLEGDNQLTVECYQEKGGKKPGIDDGSAPPPFLAIIDVVITDRSIGLSQGVRHSCFPDRPILESCLWRLIIPCNSDDLCTEEPSTSPTVEPTDGATEQSSTVSPSSDASYVETTTLPPIATFKIFHESPTSKPTKKCPKDVRVKTKKGVTKAFDNNDWIRIISQDMTSVSVELTQSFTTKPSSSIDSIFYQYHTNHFNRVCLEENDVTSGSTIDVTISCMISSPVAFLDVWIVDDIDKKVFSIGDNDATVPECCHPSDDVTEGKPAVLYYVLEIACISSCPEEGVTG